MKKFSYSFFIVLLYCATSESLYKFFEKSDIPGSRLIVVYLFLTVALSVNISRIRISKYYFYSITLITTYFIFDLLLNNNYVAKIYGYASSLSLFFSYVTFSSIRITHRDLNKILIKLLIILFVIALPSVIAAVFAKSSLRDVWYLYRELGQLGLALNFSLLISLFLCLNYKKYFIYIGLVITLLIVMTTLKKSIIESLGIWFVFFYRTKGVNINFSGKLLGLSALGFVVSIYLEDLISDIVANINYYQLFGESHVRLKMYSTALRIIIDYFPFGTGFATFGSPSSVLNGYSNIYYDYGISEIAEMSPSAIDSGIFTLFDTFWPHIFGELGVFFGILYLYLFIYPLLCMPLLRGVKLHPNSNSNLGFIAFGAVFLLFLDGLALYSPENPLFILLYGLLAGLSTSIIKSGQSNKQHFDN